MRIIYKKKAEGGHFEELKEDYDVAVKASMYYWKIKELNTKADKGIDNTSIDRLGAIINGSGKAKPNDWENRRTWKNKAINKLK